MITGAGSGIGRATALALAEGWDLLLTGRRPQPLEETAAACRGRGAACRVVAADLADPAQVDGLAGTVAEIWDGLELLVNNAGLAHRGDLERTDLGAWERLVAVNLTAPFLLSKALLSRLRRGAAPAVIHVASTLALVGRREGIAYCATKAGLLGLTRAMALDLASEGIRVNAVCPGLTRTPMVEGDPARLERLAADNPSGRIAEPGEVAAIIALLADPRASFVTGSVLTVDGGQLAGFSD
ncbi:MAG: SDR family oxidoreductase [Acidobacteriota bacterium]|nr:SDR family oxidoreductase [Acidobacteriota bacterium]